MFILKKNIAYFFVVIFCFSLIFTVGELYAQQKCLKLPDILKLLEKKVDQKEIINTIERFGADFDLDRKTTAQLVRAGANDTLLEAIEKHHCGELAITSPLPNTECGLNVKVAGRSKVFKEKFLWVFSHRKDLINQWWPQVGAVHVDSDGSWMTSARLGEVQDVGFDFELAAVWVDSLTNQRLNDYLTSSAQTGQWPPMPLPDGSPSAKVVIRKTKH